MKPTAEGLRSLAMQIENGEPIEAMAIFTDSGQDGIGFITLADGPEKARALLMDVSEAIRQKYGTPSTVLDASGQVAQ